MDEFIKLKSLLSLSAPVVRHSRVFNSDFAMTRRTHREKDVFSTVRCSQLYIARFAVIVSVAKLEF